MRATFRRFAATAVLTAALTAAPAAAHAAGCHPHPEVCEAEALSGTDHMPADEATHGPCSLGPLAWWCAATAGRAVNA